MAVRQIFFDTETTGLNPKDGHRVAEFAGIEAFDGVPTGKVFHTFINPDREVEPEASAVNGLTWDMLKDKPRFRDIADSLIAFIDGAEVVAHNASFDADFLQSELDRINYPKTFWEVVGKVVDTLPLSRQILRGQLRKFKLDNLLDFYGIDRSMRDKHDALLDCRLLVPVYQKLVEGIDMSRPSLEDDVPRPPVRFLDRSGAQAIQVAVSADELARHETYLANLAAREKVDPIAWKAKPSAPKM